MINFSNLQQYHFVSEIDILEVTTTTEVDISIKTSDGNVILSNSYVPVGGAVKVYHLHRLLSPLITNVATTFTIIAGATSKVVNVVQSGRMVSEGAMTFLPSFFLSSVMSERDTCVGRKECVSFLPFSETDVIVVCTYLNGTTVVTDAVTKGTSLAAGEVHTIDVSPSQFVDSTKGGLIGYIVTAGQRTMKYRVTELPTVKWAFLARNTFGAWEPLYFQGMTESSAEFTREMTYINGDYVPYNIEAIDTYKSQTGALRPAGIALARDVASSTEVWLMERNVASRSVVITSVDVKRSDEDDEIADLSFTWRYSTMLGGWNEAERAPKLFDETFDETYN